MFLFFIQTNFAEKEHSGFVFFSTFWSDFFGTSFNQIIFCAAVLENIFKKLHNMQNKSRKRVWAVQVFLADKLTTI